MGGGIVKRIVFVLSLTYPCGWLNSKGAVESRKKPPACKALEKAVGEFVFHKCFLQKISDYIADHDRIYLKLPGVLNLEMLDLKV